MSEWEAIKKQKVSIGAVLTFIGFVWWAYGPIKDWHFDNFVSSAQAAETGLVITRQLDKIEKVQNDHIEIYTYDRALGAIDRLEAKLYYMELTYKKGQDADADIRYRDLNKDLEKAVKYADCLAKPVEIRPNCQLLRRQRR